MYFAMAREGRKEGRGPGGGARKGKEMDGRWIPILR